MKEFWPCFVYLFVAVGGISLFMHVLDDVLVNKKL